MEGPLPYGTYSLVTTNKEQDLFRKLLHCLPKITLQSLHTWCSPAIFFRAGSDFEFISDILVISHEY